MQDIWVQFFILLASQHHSFDPQAPNWKHRQCIKKEIKKSFRGERGKYLFVNTKQRLCLLLHLILYKLLCSIFILQNAKIDLRKVVTLLKVANWNFNWGCFDYKPPVPFPCVAISTTASFNCARPFKQDICLLFI